MKITLIAPYSDITAFGMRTISSYVKERGFKTQMLFLPNVRLGSTTDTDNTYYYNDGDLKQIIECCADSDVVGISLFTYQFDRAVQITEALKRKLNIPILWGGVHPTIRPDESLEHCDIVCIGEGEEAVAELLDKMQKGQNYYNTKNFYFRKNGTVIKNPLRPLNSDLDSLPFPDYTGTNSYILDKGAGRLMQIDKFVLRRALSTDTLTDKLSYLTLTTRGCPHKCSYCVSFKDVYKREQYLRRRSVEHVIGELESITSTFTFVERINISDDSFFVLSNEEIRKFSKLYKERIKLPFRCLVSPATVNEEKLHYLVDAGLYAIKMGIQTGSPRTKMLYRRHESNESVLRAAAQINLYKQRLTAVYDFIVDNPFEHNGDIVETLRLILKLPKPYRIQLYSLVFFPGTELYIRAEQEGMLDIGKKDIYRKQFQAMEARYLNLLFLLINRGVPSPIIKVLSRKYLVLLFEMNIFRRLFSLLFKGRLFIKKLKEQYQFRRNSSPRGISEFVNHRSI